MYTAQHNTPSRTATPPPYGPSVGAIRAGRARLGHAARGFTLMEALIVLTITIILAGLVLVAIGQSIKTARQSADLNFGRTLGFCVEQFEKDNRFLPPLVLDENPIDITGSVTAGPRIRVRGEAQNPAADPGRPGRYLEYREAETANASYDSRYSRYSLSYFLAGSLPANIDGVDGGGTATPLANGQFAPNTAKRNPYFDTGRDAERVAIGTPIGNAPAITPDNKNNYTEVRDRQGKAFRMYRWAPVDHETSGVALQFPSPPNNVVARAGTVRSYNVPFPLGDLGGSNSFQFPVCPMPENPALRSARFAIVGAGRDGLFGDESILLDVASRTGAAADNMVVLEGGAQ